MKHSDFYTMRGYDRKSRPEISRTMEDYLEMIYRRAKEGSFVRVGQLAALLNVRPPSASKMAARLRECGMVDFEPYGLVRLTEAGEEMGAWLIHRHEVLIRLLQYINQSDNELETVEKIEHFIDKKTIRNIEALLDGLPERDGAVR